jgi:hypothetical protein
MCHSVFPKHTQLSFWNRKLRKTAIHADQQLWEYENGGLVQILDARKMDVDLRNKFLSVVRTA